MSEPTVHGTFLTNGQVVAVEGIAQAAPAALAEWIVQRTREGARLVVYFGYRPPGRSLPTLIAILAEDGAGRLEARRAHLTAARLDSIAERCPAAQRFEREIAEQLHLELAGHPAPRPLRYAAPWPPGVAEAQRPRPGVADFFAATGDSVHEVAVGPVHAGIIEPGHFRFQCNGEDVLNLEIALGYQHRGVEEALGQGPDRRSLHLAETVAGDTTIGHATAYAELIEALAGVTVPPRADVLRAIALELERLANHAGDLGALASDIGFLPTASYCGRIRGDYLNATALVAGNRFGRAFVRPGGVAADLDPAMVADLTARLAAAEVDTCSAVNLLWDAPSVTARFEEIGCVSREVAVELGLVGMAARASGLDLDVRRDHAWGAYRMRAIPVATETRGDVQARAHLRFTEMRAAHAFLAASLATLPAGALREPIETLAADSLAIVLVEGWRGEICHIGITASDGRFVRYKIVDPSFHNWSGLERAMRGGQISDFPLVNKSFNLSYCGHDL